MVPKDTQKSNHCCLRVSTDKSLAPQLCHRLHTAKPTRRSWLGWPALRMHGTLGVVRRPTMRQEEPYMDLSCNPHLVWCAGERPGHPWSALMTFVVPSLQRLRPDQGPVRGARNSLTANSKGLPVGHVASGPHGQLAKKNVPTCPSFSPPVAYVHCKTVHLGAYL